MLRNSDDLRSRIVRNLGSCTVALFGVSVSAEGEQLLLAGTGTLIERNGLHYILTAAHVWEEVLESSSKVGITLAEGIDHRHLFDTRAVLPEKTLKEKMWGEWGPDITLLRIPIEHVGGIKAFKA